MKNCDNQIISKKGKYKKLCEGKLEGYNLD